jgi:pimeloyl-ACP methyl ester carboxylesterase
MNIRRRDGVSLAYEDNAQGVSPIVFIHGWSCDHTMFAPQIEYFGARHRVVAVDLRGHGKSDAPQGEYTLPSFADDVAWLLGELSIDKATIVGHSMGGQVALEFGARHPELTEGVVLIDSVVFPSPAIIEWLRPAVEALRTPTYQQSVREMIVPPLFLPAEQKEQQSATRVMERTAQHVMVSALRNHTTEYDATDAASRWRGPVAYIGAQTPLGDTERFRKISPQLQVGQTIGSGHFSQLVVPSQINAMLDQFVHLRAA